MFGKPLSDVDQQRREFIEGLRNQISVQQFRINDLRQTLDACEDLVNRLSKENDDLKRREYERTPIYDRIRWSTGIDPQEQR